MIGIYRNLFLDSLLVVTNAKRLAGSNKRLREVPTSQLPPQLSWVLSKRYTGETFRR